MIFVLFIIDRDARLYILSYLIFDIYEQMCSAHMAKILQYDASREKFVESLHCRMLLLSPRLNR